MPAANGRTTNWKAIAKEIIPRGHPGPRLKGYELQPKGTRSSTNNLMGIPPDMTVDDILAMLEANRKKRTHPGLKGLFGGG